MAVLSTLSRHSTPDPDKPARNADGSLKDAKEMEWVYSPSSPALPPAVPPSDTAEPTSPTMGRGLRKSKPTKKMQESLYSMLSKASKPTQPSTPVALSRGAPRRRKAVSSLASSPLSSSAPPSSAPPSPTPPAPTSSRKRPSNAKDSSGNAKRLRVSDSLVSTRTDSAEDDRSLNKAPSESHDSEMVHDSDSDDEAYLETKKMIDDDCFAGVAVKKRRKDLTADVRLVFTPGKITVDGHTQKGHWCEICKALKKDGAWFAGGVSTLRKHIQRNPDTHWPVYSERCKKANIGPNHLAVPTDLSDGKAPKQATLDGFTQPQPKWTKEGLQERIVRLVVAEDESIRLVESEAFREVLKFQRPQTRESDIPHRTKLRDVIIERTQDAIQELGQILKGAPGKISYTFDTWTSRNFDPYIAVTGHYIRVDPKDPCKWSLESDLLCFSHIVGNHGAENTAKYVCRALDRYGIYNKRGWSTSDNVSTNDKVVEYVESAGVINGNKQNRASSKDVRVRCGPHGNNLCAQHFLEEVCPTPSRYKKHRTSPTQECDENDFDEDEAGMEADEEANLEFEAKDVLGKVLAFITQIRLSCQARAYFLECCKREGVKPLELRRWVRTRWSSMHDMLDRFLDLQPAVDYFILNADRDKQVPKLKNKRYSQFAITDEEWHLLRLVHELLRAPHAAQQELSSEKHPMLWKTIPIMELLQTHWEHALKNPRFKPLEAGLKAGLRSLNKYYRYTDDCPAIVICQVLNPSLKMEYINSNWDEGFRARALETLEKTFDEYYKPTDTATPAPHSPQATSGFNGFAASWIAASIPSRLYEAQSSKTPRGELRRYLQTNLVRPEGLDLVTWWGLRQEEYPTLARMALDYLPIQGSAVACERKFSSAGVTGTDRRSRLSTITFEALQILKSWYKGQHDFNTLGESQHGGELNEDEVDMLLHYVPGVEMIQVDA